MDYKIVISGTIGSWNNGCSADYVRYVLNNNKDKEVHVGFCSLGGFVKDGLEMNQAFKDHGNVHAHAFGMNASISTIAMLGCKSIDIVKGSFFLIHNVSTWIERFEQTNKEQLDEYISKLQQERATLKTFDDVLASLYAEKTGKSIDECLAQMKKGNWMTAQQAKDFGLVDEIREDKKTEKAAEEYTNQFINSYTNSFKDAGIPPLTFTNDENNELSSVVDENGNPTHSFLQKTWQGLQSLFRNPQANIYQQKSMIKIFATVMSILNCADGFKPQNDGSIALTQEQMKKIDDELSNQKKTLDENASAMKAAATKIEELKNDKAQLEKKEKELEEQIANLKGAPANDPDSKVVDTADKTISANELFNLVKEA